VSEGAGPADPYRPSAGSGIWPAANAANGRRGGRAALAGLESKEGKLRFDLCGPRGLALKAGSAAML
jgi:hypothetical protein